MADTSLLVAFQMDPIGAINIDADSSFRLAEEAQARGHRLFYYTPDKLSYQEGRVMARGQDLTVRRVKGDHFDVGPMRRHAEAVAARPIRTRVPRFPRAHAQERPTASQGRTA